AAHVPAEARPEARRRAALQICRDALARRLSRASEEALAPAAPTDESVRDAFGDLERSVASDGWEGVFPFGAAARTADGRTVADPLRAHLDGADLAAFRSAALTDIKSARSRALHEADARRREAREKTVRASVEKELSFRDLPPERWADAYEALGRDEALKRTDPARAMRCLDAAREMREAERRAGERKTAGEKAAARAAGASAAEVKSNEENLARSLAMLDLLKMEGSLSQDDANEAQAAIWRRFRALSLGGQLSPSFMRSFVTRISGQLSDQEANAMRRFYQAFGYQGELSAQGEVTAAERKSNAGTDYYAPREAGDRHSDNYFRIPADELFRYGDSLLRTLRALGPDMNREGVVEKEIARMKKDWRKGQFDKNREASVRSVMDMQREARTRWNMAQPAKRSGEDDGRREDDGNPAK
ncbi:MAG: hypothetical protein IKL96_08120, partial [Kiritimatiellae bacterium]|nr:hypothetical protein [Kiritimatiellia bacterium]